MNQRFLCKRRSSHMQIRTTDTASSSSREPVDGYSIRHNHLPGSRCAGCEEKSTWDGPVGYLGTQPICDICLLVGCPELGLLLALGILARAFAADSEDASAAERATSLDLLAIFALVFDRKSTWPRRNEYGNDILLYEVASQKDRDRH